MLGLAARFFDLPAEARDWLQPGDRSMVWLGADPTPDDVRVATDVLRSWDALAGRIVRLSMFADEPPQLGREARKTAEAVAAVAHALAIRLRLDY